MTLSEVQRPPTIGDEKVTLNHLVDGLFKQVSIYSSIYLIYPQNFHDSSIDMISTLISHRPAGGFDNFIVVVYSMRTSIVFNCRLCFKRKFKVNTMYLVSSKTQFCLLIWQICVPKELGDILMDFSQIEQGGPLEIRLKETHREENTYIPKI